MLRLLVVLLATWMPGISHAANPLPDTIARIKPSVVAVGSYNPSGRPRQVFRGTGFVVGNGHQVVTNHHVLPTSLDKEKHEKIAVFSGSGKRVRHHKARILVSDPLHDLVLLYISEPLPAMQLGSSGSLREGDEIAFTGFPIGMVLGMYPVTHRGIIASMPPKAQPQVSPNVLTPGMIQAMRRPYKVLQLDATAYPGNSGSAVFKQDTGKVVGVINSVFVKKTREAAIENPTGITYAIPVKFVKDMLKKAR